MKQEYIFTLKFKLPPNIAPVEELVDELYAKGCDDALIGMGITGQLALEFAREDNNADQAIRSALQDVLNTIPGAKLIEASPDYVGLTDIAEVVSVSRQQMRKLYEQNISFPAPVYSGSSSLWNLAEVLDWIKENKNYTFSETLHAVAKTNLQLNLMHRKQPAQSHQPSSYKRSITIAHNRITISTTFNQSSNTLVAGWLNEHSTHKNTSQKFFFSSRRRGQQ